jgi:hypothetical protein
VKVLFDQNVPRNLADYLTAHQVTRSIELGWDRLKNGDLLTVAQELGFDVLVTCDRNLRLSAKSEESKARDCRSAGRYLAAINGKRRRDC